ncbi:MAG: MTH938/NDUFAF3 family protein [Burkholderiaceae bacterium]|nr:MTH938/NDUFAF3 family protein [Burkholderiaceae bacterium]
MKLHADPLTHLNTVTAYGPGFVEINKALRAEDFAALVGRAPELVLLGTGSRQRFPHPRLTRALTDARIGVEVMDTPAAARTYNILMSEGRRVLAVLLQDAQGTP